VLVGLITRVFAPQATVCNGVGNSLDEDKGSGLRRTSRCNQESRTVIDDANLTGCMVIASTGNIQKPHIQLFTGNRTVHQHKVTGNKGTVNGPTKVDPVLTQNPNGSERTVTIGSPIKELVGVTTTPQGNRGINLEDSTGLWGDARSKVSLTEYTPRICRQDDTATSCHITISNVCICYCYLVGSS
jgi:hypothetical protein